jgi:outer membrane protein assembly factor BamB
MAHDVFISYSAEDRTTANAVCATLEASQIRCWIAPRDIVPGQRWAEAVVDAIKDSRAMVLVFSSNSNGSQQVWSEIELAVNAGVDILPFRIEDVPLSSFMQYHIGNRHWLDALTPPLRRHLKKLAEKTKLLLSQPDEPEQLPAEAESHEPVGAMESAIGEAPRKSTPPRSAHQVARRSRSGSMVRLVAALATAAVIVIGIAVFFLVALLSGGDGDSGSVVLPPTRGESSPTVVTVHPTPVPTLVPPTTVPTPGPLPALLWRFETSDDVASSPAVVDGVVYVGSNDGYLYALDAATGDRRWRFKTAGPVYPSPAVVDGVVYIGGGSSYYALDAATGEEHWRFQHTAVSHVYCSPAVADGIVYVGGGSRVYALDADTGEELWRFQPAWNSVFSPAVAEGVVYIASEDGYIDALDAATGNQLWRFEAGDQVESSPAVADGVVYIGSYDSYVYTDYVYALEADTGEELWRFDIDGSVRSSPTVAEGVVYIGSFDHLYALDATTGEERWRFETPAWVRSSAAVAEDMVYIGGFHGLYALDEATGKELWRFETEGYVESSPAVADGVIYIGSHDGYIYAITEE